METVLVVLQAISAILLIAAILLQNQGSGVSELFGGQGNVYKTKRGVEKLLYISTIVLAITFFGVSLLQTII